MTSRKHWILAAAGLFLLVCGAGIAVMHVAVNRWLAGDEFRRWASREVSEALGVEGEFLPPRWSQTTVYSDGFQAVGRPGGGLAAVRADQVRAQFDLRAVLEGVWRLDSLTTGRLRLDVGDSGERRPPESAPGGQGRPTSEADGKARARGGGWGFLTRWVPRRFELRRVQTDAFDLRWPAGDGKRGSISGTRVEAKPADRAWEFHGAGGVLRHPGAPEMAIGEFQVRLDWPALYITSADLKPADGGAGRVVLSGDAVLAGEGAINLDVVAEGLPVERFVEGDWRARLAGRISGRGSFRGPTRGEGLAAEGDFLIEEGLVEALPVLNEIASLTGTKEFRSIRLDRATARVRWSGAALSFEDVWLESHGLLRVNGRLTDTGGAFEGEFEVGTTPDRLRLLPGARRYVFTREADGYLWAVPPVRVGGTRKRFSEDLTPRLGTAAVREFDDRAGGVLRSVLDVIEGLLR